MAGPPPATAPAPGSSLRIEVLKELQSLIDDRGVRDRLDKGPIGETKGREHWVLHLLLRAQESQQAHTDLVIQTAYANLTARLQGIEDRLQRIETVGQTLGDEVKTRMEGLEAGLVDRVAKEIGTGVESASGKLNDSMAANLEERWKPIGHSVEEFASASGQLTKDLSDTYRVATQSRLLLNENARRMIDLGRDIVALEDSLKLALAKVIEDGLQPLEERISALEARLAAADADPTANGRTASSGGA